MRDYGILQSWGEGTRGPPQKYTTEAGANNGYKVVSGMNRRKNSQEGNEKNSRFTCLKTNRRFRPAQSRPPLNREKRTNLTWTGEKRRLPRIRSQSWLLWSRKGTLVAVDAGGGSKVRLTKGRGALFGKKRERKSLNSKQ